MDPLRTPLATGALSTADRPEHRILLVLPQQKAARRFELMLTELGARGHRVHLGLTSQHRAEADGMVDGLCERYPRITRGPAPVRDDRWGPLAWQLRRGIDYLRYLSPEYAQAPKLRARGARWAPPAVVGLASRPVVRSRAGIRVLDRALRWLESSLPDSPAVQDYLRERQPDLVLVSPLVDQPWQADYVRGARALGLRVGLLVLSWDNLTNKGLIRDQPDRVYLWNDEQRREAIELHGVAPDRIVATGAHSFDHWFDWRPSTTAEEFRHRVGLPVDGALVLYVCSSTFIAPDEAAFVERWLDALRAHPDERLREAAVLIRPHPKTGGNWEDSPLAQRPRVAVWPRRGSFNVDAESNADYFDSIHHSAAVVGLNTSALIESAIVGRPVLTVLDPEYRETQEGTLHFHYLLRENGGPLIVGADFDEHFRHLADALGGRAGDGGVEREFVRRFVRPHGLERPAVGVLVDAIEQQVAAPAAPRRRARIRRALGARALSPLADRASGAVGGDRRRRAAEGRRSRGRPPEAAAAPFIVGVPRSGTTLLRLMLDSHPALAIPPETHFVPDLIRACRKSQMDADAVVALLVSQTRWPHFELAEREVRSRMPSGPGLEAGDVLRAFYGAYAARHGKPRWGDKTPRYLRAMHKIARALPEARFVHIIRDPRDVALSMTEMELTWPDSIPAAALRWRKIIEAGRRRASRVEHYLEIRYEDLVLDTEATLRSVCEFIDLEWDASMLEYHERAEERMQVAGARARPRPGGKPPIPAGYTAQVHALTTRPPQADRVGRWRTDMGPEDLAACEKVLDGLLAELGYEPALSASSR